jgi:excisionase family DNA binding protein
MAEQSQPNTDELVDLPSSRISVLEIARRLSIGRLAVYSMLEQGIIPGLRLGRRWIYPAGNIVDALDRRHG